MSARDELTGFCLAALPNEQGFAKAERLADAFRAEVLREAADSLDALPVDASSFDRAEHKYKGGAAADTLRRMADAARSEPTRQEAEAADQPIAAIRRVKEDGRWVVRWRLGGRRRQVSCDTGAEAYEYMRYLYAKAQDEGGGRDA